MRSLKAPNIEGADPGGTTPEIAVRLVLAGEDTVAAEGTDVEVEIGFAPDGLERISSNGRDKFMRVATTMSASRCRQG